ncbi:hypothetical protein EDD22DRAFT_982440 [Suillus occidentalis]|nr:hypothetical protein EDD22DRAFT_982440 [Suillus occidentalis]
MKTMHLLLVILHASILALHFIQARIKRHRISSNPLVLHGRHFGWTVFTLCNYPALLTLGILCLEDLEGTPIKDYPADVQREHRVFMELIDSYLGLLDHLMNGKEEDVIHVGELMGKGASGTQGNDMKTLKSAVFEWLVPRGQAVIPPLSRNIKSDHGFNLCPAGLNWSNAETKQSLKSSETTVHGDQWPMFLYTGYAYDPRTCGRGFKHVFTSPSSVDKELKAMHSRNAYLHSMKSITKGSLAYIAMQVRFSLSSSSIFSHTNMVMDSQNFYHSILDLLEDLEESVEVVDLMTWWTCHIFPNSSSSQRCISKNSTLAKIWEKCAAL